MKAMRLLMIGAIGCSFVLTGCGKKVTTEEARDIALKDAGLSEKEVRFIESLCARSLLPRRVNQWLSIAYSTNLCTKHGWWLYGRTSYAGGRRLFWP